jgi:cobalt/nickel transport system permease protein
VKIVVFTLFLVAVALVQGLAGAVLALALAVVWLLLSRIPLGFTLLRLKGVILFLLSFLALLPLTDPFGWQHGLERGGVIFLKGLAMVLTVLPMFGTTPFHVSMKALRRLGVPDRLVAMILFAYRYIFVFGDEARTLQQALKARGFKGGANRRSLKYWGNLLGLMVVRAFERTERIYQAMLARGFKERFGTLHEFSCTWPDALKSGAVALASLALVGVDRLWMM